MEFYVLAAIFLALVFVGLVMIVIGSRVVRALDRRREARLPAQDLPIEYLTEHHRLVRPLRQARTHISDLVRKHPKAPQVTAMGEDILKEADHVIVHCQDLVGQIDGLRRVSLQKPSAIRALDALKRRMPFVRSDAEREGCLAAIAARESEMAHYDAAARHADALEGVVLQAQAALAELHARLFTSLEVSQPLEGQTEGLREGLGRLRAFRESVEEAEEVAVQALEKA